MSDFIKDVMEEHSDWSAEQIQQFWDFLARGFDAAFAVFLLSIAMNIASAGVSQFMGILEQCWTEVWQTQHPDRRGSDSYPDQDQAQLNRQIINRLSIRLGVGKAKQMIGDD